MFDYVISEKGLKHFRDNCLNLVSENGQVYEYTFNYQGSICRDGGTSFTSIFHIIIKVDDSGICFKEGYIELPKDNNQGVLKMCGYTDERFVEKLKQPPAFCGRNIEEILKMPMKTNYAGCFCHEPMINDKWRMVLSTVHYALTKS